MPRCGLVRALARSTYRRPAAPRHRFVRPAGSVPASASVCQVPEPLALISIAPSASPETVSVTGPPRASGHPPRQLERRAAAARGRIEASLARTRRLRSRCPRRPAATATPSSRPVRGPESSKRRDAGLGLRASAQLAPPTRRRACSPAAMAPGPPRADWSRQPRSRSGCAIPGAALDAHVDARPVGCCRCGPSPAAESPMFPAASCARTAQRLGTVRRRAVLTRWDRGRSGRGRGSGTRPPPSIVTVHMVAAIPPRRGPRTSREPGRTPTMSWAS